jgi:hypothetical protein
MKAYKAATHRFVVMAPAGRMGSNTATPAGLGRKNSETGRAQ